MKRLIFATAVMALLGIASCQNADVKEPAANGDSFVTFSATLPAEMCGTRAAGDGTQVNRCIMEIYLNGVRYGEPAVKPVVDNTATFSARLISGKTYDLVFWADAANGTDVESFEDNHYDTSSLTNVTIKDADSYLGNDDTRDAFFASTQIFVEMSTSVNVQLRRPFGQLNVKTLDMADAKAANIESLLPTHVSVAFKAVPAGINLLTGELLTATDAIAYSEKCAVVDEDGTLSMDYIFAPQSEGEQYLADFTMSFLNADGGEAVADYVFTSIPLQRNYRTNVSGNFLTKKADIKVEIKPEFEEDAIEKEIVEVATIADANEAFANGAKNVVVAVAPEQAATVVIPHDYSDEDVALSLTLPATAETVTVAYGEIIANAPETITIAAALVENLVIETDKSTVSVNGEYVNVSASTADNTLIVGEDTVIETLTLVKGNAKLYGTVGAVVKASGYKGTIYRCFDTQASFDNLLADDKSGYTEILVENAAAGIDAKNVQLTRQMTVKAPLEISNLNIKVDYKEAFAAFYVKTGVAKVSVDNFYITSTKTAQRTARVDSNNKGVYSFTNGKFILAQGSYDRSALNLVSEGGDCDMDITFDNVLFSSQEELINVDKNIDYPYSQEMKNKLPGSSRGITFGAEVPSETAKMKVTMKNSAVEQACYCVNSTLQSIQIDFTAENCVIDGRAALNVWGNGLSHWNFKNSKLIGRNWFSGPTEDFATIVLNYTTPSVADQYVVLDGCDVVSDNDPQTDTNHQYIADLRSDKYNKLEIKNGTKLREVTNPRLNFLIGFYFWGVNEVVWDDTVIIECAKDCVMLEPESDFTEDGE